MLDLCNVLAGYAELRIESLSSKKRWYRVSLSSHKIVGDLSSDYFTAYISFVCEGSNNNRS